MREVIELGNFQFVEYKLNEHFNRFEFYEEFGGNATFPQVRLTDKKWVDVQKLLNTSENIIWSNGKRRRTH